MALYSGRSDAILKFAFFFRLPVMNNRIKSLRHIEYIHRRKSCHSDLLNMTSNIIYYFTNARFMIKIKYSTSLSFVCLRRHVFKTSKCGSGIIIASNMSFLSICRYVELLLSILFFSNSVILANRELKW